MPWPSLDGINSGSNSYGAILGQIQTKAFNGTIDDFTWQTTGKIFTYQLATDIPQSTLLNGVESNGETYFFGNGSEGNASVSPDFSGTGTYLEQDVGGKFAKVSQ